MATKKQKRQEAMQKRLRFMEEYVQEGLEAQRRDREKRELDKRKAWQDVHDKKHHKFINECPLCTEIKKRQAIERIAKASA